MSTRGDPGAVGSLEPLFKHLCESDVPFAVMRNYQEVPVSTGGSDLDVFVLPADHARFVQVAERAIRLCGGATIGRVSSPTFTSLGAFGRRRRRDDWWAVQFDILAGLAYKGIIPLVDPDALMASRTYHRGVPVLPSGLANALGVLKELLHNDSISERYLADARAAFQVDAILMARVFAPLGGQIIEQLRNLCLDRSPSDGRTEGRRLRRRLITRSLRTRPWILVRGWLRFEVSRLKRLYSPPGLTLGVLGPDGVGKSTIIRELVAVLDPAVHGSVHTRHLRPGLLPPLGLLRTGRRVGHPVMTPHAASPAGPVGSMLRLLWLWLDYSLGYLLVVRPLIWRKPSCVIFDRHALDLVMDPRRFRVSLPSNMIRWVVRSIPPLDMSICLIGGVEVIRARKTELSREEIARQIQVLRVQAAESSSVAVICTEGPILEVRDAVLDVLRDWLDQRGRAPT